MRTTIFITLIVALFGLNTECNAQGFLKKLSKATEKAAETAVEATTDVMTVSAFLEAIPSYEIQKYRVGTAEDGTENYAYYVVDTKTGNIRNGGAVAKQYVMLAIAGYDLVKSLKNVRGLAAVKAGADAIIVTKQVKSLIDQAKLMNAYKKTFTVEGTPREAEVDLTNVDGFDFTASAVLEKSAEDVAKEIEAAKNEDVDEDFNVMDALSGIAFS